MKSCFVIVTLCLVFVVRAEENIAGNETAAAAACMACAEAQEIYHRTDYDSNGVLEYCQTIRGGKRDIAAELDPAKLPKPTADEEAQIQKLIKNLGSEEFAVREGAAKDLMTFGTKAYNLIQTAQSTQKDAEVVSRCRTLAKQISESLAPERKGKLQNGLFMQPDGTVLALVDQKLADAECPIGVDAKNVTAKAGYLFRVLTKQELPVKRNYIVNGNMTLGYAFIAFPKEYGVTGKKCFMISNAGTIYQRDFGSKEKTDEYIKGCDTFNPSAPEWSAIQ